MECKICKKECLDSELKEGYCVECFKLKRINNPIANYLKIGSYLLIVIGIILVIISSLNEYDVYISIGCIICTIFISLFYRGMAEIIQLLEDVSNK